MKKSRWNHLAGSVGFFYSCEKRSSWLSNCTVTEATNIDLIYIDVRMDTDIFYFAYSYKMGKCWAKIQDVHLNTVSVMLLGHGIEWKTMNK